MIEFKNKETEQSIKTLLEQPTYKPTQPHTIYYKMVNGRIVDSITEFI